jgi:cytoskeletal protein RodZ
MTDFETFLADLRHPDEHLNVPDLNQIMVAGRRLRLRRKLIAGGGAIAVIALALAIPIGVLADRRHNTAQSEQPGSSTGTVVGTSPTPDSSPSSGASPSTSSSPSASTSSSPSASTSSSPSASTSTSFSPSPGAGESAWPGFMSSSATPPDPSTGAG